MSKNENISTNSLLQEFIETILEAEGGNDLYNTFIQPFVDVGITAAYGLEKLSAQVLTVVKGFFLGLPTLFVPFLEYDYEAFREEEAEKVENVKKKYEKTLQANLDAIVSNDAFGLAQRQHGKAHHQGIVGHVGEDVEANISIVRQG